MSGLGAWSFGFYHKGMAVPNDRVAAGVQAFKHALIDNGYGTGIDLTARGFGNAMRSEVKRFQAHEGLTADGVIGPATSHALIRLYAYAEESGGTVEIPDHLLAKQGRAESGDDPVAQGYDDAQDEGWAQLHMPYFPDLTLAQAWKPPVAVQKLGSHLKTFFVDEAADWDGAVASWNVGTGTALAWVHAGKPASGDVVGGVDWYVRATRYVALVKSQPA